MSEAEKKWYVVRTISGKEKKVKEQLENEVNRLNIKEYISQVIIPTEKIYQIRKGKKISKERNFFPGYILIEAALVGEIEHIIKNVPNVLGFLVTKNVTTSHNLKESKDKKNRKKEQREDLPTPLRPQEVNRILGKVDELSEKGEEINIPFIIGEVVTVIDGPFNSFSGVIEEINEEKKKLKVMVKIFGRKTPLELNFTQVEKE